MRKKHDKKERGAIDNPENSSTDVEIQHKKIACGQEMTTGRRQKGNDDKFTVCQTTLAEDYDLDGVKRKFAEQ